MTLSLRDFPDDPSGAYSQELISHKHLIMVLIFFKYVYICYMLFVLYVKMCYMVLIFFINLFILFYLFFFLIFGCVGSSLLHVGFL